MNKNDKLIEQDKIEFSKNELELIDKVLKKQNFSHKSWEDDEIKELRDRIKKHYIVKQEYTCPYCRQINKTLNGRVWDIEHIISRISEPNFMFEPKNLCVSCIDCNLEKKDKKVTISKAKKKLPNNSSDYLIVHPHFDTYNDKIVVIEPGSYYIAKKDSDKGKTTIEICGLNRFYKFSNYDNSIDITSKINSLSKRLSNCKDELEKNEILKEITKLSLDKLTSS